MNVQLIQEVWCDKIGIIIIIIIIIIIVGLKVQINVSFFTREWLW